MSTIVSVTILFVFLVLPAMTITATAVKPTITTSRILAAIAGLLITIITTARNRRKTLPGRRRHCRRPCFGRRRRGRGRVRDP